MKKALGLAQKEGYQCWDLFSESIAWKDKLLIRDGLHYGPAGHTLIAERLFSLLRNK